MYCLICLLDVRCCCKVLWDPCVTWWPVPCLMKWGAESSCCFTLCTVSQTCIGLHVGQHVNSAAWCGWTRFEKNPKVNNLMCNFKGGIYPSNWQFCVNCVLQETKKKIVECLLQLWDPVVNRLNSHRHSALFFGRQASVGKILIRRQFFFSSTSSTSKVF